MYRYFAACLTALIPLFSFGQPGGKIISIDPVSLPVYDSIPDASDYFSKDYYHQLKSDTGFVFEKLVYESMDLNVVAYVGRPKTVSKERKLPVILFNRAGYIRNNMTIDYLSLFHTLVDEGFVVVAPALRESEGGEGKDEAGGKDLADIWNVLPYIKSREYIDLRNVFMLGESRGGIMTLQLLKAGFPVQAAAVYGATTDFGAYMEQSPEATAIAQQIWPDYESNPEPYHQARSAVQWADRIRVPLLIMAGSADETIDPQHSLDLATELNRHKKDYELIIFNGGNHSLDGKDLERRNEEVLRWFRHAMR